MLFLWLKKAKPLPTATSAIPKIPRIAHTLNIKLDEYGNVLESASVVYPRKTADVSLPAETQEAQNKTLIIYTQNSFTNDIDTC